MGASLDLDMVAPGQPIDPRITFTRASTATFFNSSGVLTSAGNNVARFDYNPTTLAARGLLIEEQRTNSIRNNTMQGAVAGTPGTLPTNWSASLAGALSREVVGSGTLNGINYVDVRVFGTPTNTNLALNLYFDNATQIAALTGQTWTESVWVQMVGGSTTNITQVYLAAVEVSSGGADLAYLSGTNFLSTIGTFTRRTYTATTANASTAFIRPALWMSHSGIGNPVDITLRIGLPQLEQGAFATSVIPTTTTALTRNADVASVNTLSPWYNASEGTLFAEWTSFIPNGTSSGITYSVGFSDNVATTTAAQLVIQNRAVTNQIRVWQSTTGGGLDDSITLSTTTFQGKAAAVYGGAANVAASANGSAVVTMTNPLQTTAFNALTVGSASGTATNSGPLNGHLRRITYYPRRLSNAELQAITA